MLLGGVMEAGTSLRPQETGCLLFPYLPLLVSSFYDHVSSFMEVNLASSEKLLLLGV